MPEDSRRPFRRVDLCNKCAVDEPRALEQLLVIPLRIVQLQAIADRVVLTRKHRVQHA